VRITSFDAPPGSGDFGCLEIVSDRSPPDRDERFRIEAGTPRLIRCAVDGVARLWARPDRYLQGIWVLRSDHQESPNVLPPWRFDLARAAAHMSRDKGEFHAGWAKQMAKAIFETPRAGLGRGTYRFTRARTSTNRSDWGGPCGGAPADVSEAYESSQPEWLHWEGAFGVTHPLRSRPAEDDARVKAWRKAAREGWLPPLLLMWISGLNAYVVLDGHCRLRAAELEAADVDALVLWRVVQVPNEGTGWRDEVVERYEYATRRYAVWQPETAAFLNRQLVDAFAPSSLLARSIAVGRADLRDVFVVEVQERLRQLGQSPDHAMLEDLADVPR
jgi:hypothetical protein